MTIPFDLTTYLIAASVVGGAYVLFGISAFGAALALGVRISRDADWSELRWMAPLSLLARALA